MPRSHRLFPALLVALAGAVAAAQPQSQPGSRPELRPGLSPAEAHEWIESMSPTNAALVYYRIWISSDPQLNDTYPHFNETDEDDDETGLSLEEATQILEHNQNTIAQYIAAADLEECDFGIAYGDGWNALLPHLGKLRAATRMLNGDARRHLADGDAGAAAARAGAIYGMAWQVRNDRVLISSLVSAAMADVGHKLAAELIDSGELTDAQRDDLAARLERFLGADDPFNVRACIGMEAALSIGWIEKLAQQTGADRPLGDRLANDGFLGDGSEATRRKLNALSAAEIRRESQRLSDYYETIDGLWDDPDSVEKIQALGALVESGAYGVLTQTFGASLDRAREAELRAIGEVEDTLAALYAYEAPDEEPEATDAPDGQ